MMNEHKLINGKPVPLSPEDVAQREADRAAEAARFPERKAAMREDLREAAEAARLRWVTPGSAKSLEYEAKRREAQRILADVAAGRTPAPAGYPFAARRAARLGVGLEAVAREWQAKAAAWAVAGAEIADLTEAAAAAIEALTDPATLEADARAIIFAIAWPTPR